ncbi:MAG: bifunctional diaminohydroxyphosphoribosylaminopyrimidine deaminase/5-amino-6-(5-phosphoribosylamino)uracil reductase RibD [Gammaproteobacteria bacterium]
MMRRALDLAENGYYSASPNPRVGCVIARDNIVIGEGWHKASGAAHAETIALQNAIKYGGDLHNAEVFVNMEPCAHVGKTPSCAAALARAKPAAVHIAALDPNPLTFGRGAAMLKKAGIAVRVLPPDDVLARRAVSLNAGFYSRMIRKLPWVRIKLAATIDGKTALANGKSKWLTAKAARDDVHRWRARSCAILTGVGTAEKDDPLLTVRAFSIPRQPLRVLVDSSLRAPPHLRMFNDGGKTLIATCQKPPPKKKYGKNTEVVQLPGADDKTDLAALLSLLAARGINEVMVEAGRKLCGAVFAAGFADELVVYTAARILGDDALPMFASPPPKSINAAPRFAVRSVDTFAPGDIRVVYENPAAIAAIAGFMRRRSPVV